jgi:hypothetical protein
MNRQKGVRKPKDPYSLNHRYGSRQFIDQAARYNRRAQTDMRL